MTTIRALTLALLASVGFADARATHFVSKRNDTVITDDTYFYGQSPAVYPSPSGKGTGDWAIAYEKAAALVAQMTLEEKTNMTGGRTTLTGCSGEIQPVERLGFPGMCLSDAGNGVRGTDFVNAYASGLSVGASWNKDLAYQRGAHMGAEFKKKGVNVALGPVVGPLGRVVESGRIWEGSSNDPYLAGSLAANTVKGTQDVGVITSLKHFIGNEQELRRNPITDDDGNTIGDSVSSNIDDKTMHELYLWAFMEPIRAGTGNIMCSYNRLNNSHSCGNSAALNGLLKTELGFQGFVVSDWLAQHSGVSTALAGLDMVMPLGSAFWGSNLTEAVTNGSVSVSRLDDMATRVLAAWYQMGQDEDFPELGVGMPIDLMAPHEIVNAKDPASKQVIFDGAVEGHVLVKNVNNALPLKSPQLVSVFGYSAYSPMTANPAKGSMSGWSMGYEATDVRAAYSGFGIAGSPDLPIPNVAINGTIISGGGSGANNPAYISSPLNALSQQAYEDNTSLLWDFTNINGTAYVDGASDVCLVFINAFASEGFDRPAIHDDYSDNLVINIADQCNNTMVIIHNAGVYLVDAFVDHPNVTAILYAHVPGQDSGRATTSILYGKSVPSGKLPYTVAKNESDYGSLLSHTVGEGEFSYFPQSNFTEGVYIDYRAFDAQNITPRYEFGFGLSYTTFSYSNITVTQLSNVSTDAYPVGDVVQGGAEDLWDVLATVTADVTNTGSVNGSEVAQLYINVPGGPVRQLRGYSKVPVSSGATESVSFDITRRDLSEWDVTAQKWHLQSGSYEVSVGASSRDLPLTSTIVI